MSNFSKDLKDVKVLLFYGNNDSLINDENLRRLMKLLPKDAEAVEIDDYNHVDYMWANDAN